MTKRTKPHKATINEGIQANEINAQAIAVGRGAKAVVTNNASDANEDIKKSFAVLLEKVESMSAGADKEVAQSAVKALEAEAQKGEDAQVDNVQKWLRFLAQVAPDVWEVAVSTFLNPVRGLSLVFQKVDQRAKSS